MTCLRRLNLFDLKFNKLLNKENYGGHPFCKYTQKARPCNFLLAKRYVESHISANCIWLVNKLKKEQIMLEEILKKNVVISVGTTDFSYVVKGEVVDVSDSWLKVQTKKNLEYIKVDAIIKVAVTKA